MGNRILQTNELLQCGGLEQAKSRIGLA
jgi:hypothetical protein